MAGLTVTSLAAAAVITTSSTLGNSADNLVGGVKDKALTSMTAESETTQLKQEVEKSIKDGVPTIALNNKEAGEETLSIDEQIEQAARKVKIIQVQIETIESKGADMTEADLNKLIALGDKQLALVEEIGDIKIREAESKLKAAKLKTAEEIKETKAGERVLKMIDEVGGLTMNK